MARRSRHISLVVAAALALPALVPGSAAAGDCGGAYLSASAAQVEFDSVEHATRCLLNAQRRRHGRRPLRQNRRLELAATRHARDMAENNYFSHDSIGGNSFLDRIRRVDYLPRYRGWTVGENLAWGSEQLSTPKEIVRAWMHSPAHKANILNPRFREIGIGIVDGAPVGGASNAATYATEFGARL
jgi:uncharacterized protein YkwD